MKTPRVSVIIPVYNGAEHIAETLDSVLCQTVSDIEVIIVNDGSSDATGSIISNIKDPRIRYFEQANQGVSAARNHGMAEARADWFAFVDADDLWVPRKLADQLAVATVPALIYSSCNFLIGDRISDKDFNQISPPPAEADDVLSFMIRENNFIPACTVLVHRSWIDKVGGFDTTRRYCEDFDLWLRLAEAGCPFIWTGKIHGSYRLHDTNSSQNVVTMERAHADVLMSLSRRLDDIAKIHMARERAGEIYYHSIDVTRTLRAGLKERLNSLYVLRYANPTFKRCAIQILYLVSPRLLKCVRPSLIHAVQTSSLAEIQGL